MYTHTLKGLSVAVMEKTKEEMFSLLQSKMKGMDLPAHRRMTDTLQNIRWLRKNMNVKNSEHPRLKECEELCDLLLEAG